MKFEIITREIELEKDLKEYIEKKISSIERKLGDEKQDAEAEVRVGKDGSAQKGNVYFADIKIDTGKNVFEAKEIAESVKAALDLAKDEVDKQVRRERSKFRDIVRNSSRKLKRILRGFKK